MTVTRQGVKFARQDNPGAVAFVDTGRQIKDYGQEDASILAALQLALQKWGGVQVSGTDEYKRRCAELAVKNGIRIVNPELQGVIKEAQEQKARESSMSIFTMAKVLGQKALGERMIIVTSAYEGKEYSGTLLGVLEKDGFFYAAQHFGDNHIILHDVELGDLSALKALLGQEIWITSGNGRIENVVVSRSRSEIQTRNRGRSR
jgi:hypothetical protein